MTSNEEKQLEELYGPKAQHSDYQIGDHIRYRRLDEIVDGEVLWCCAAGTSLTGQPLPLRYFVAPSDGFVDSVWQSDILAE